VFCHKLAVDALFYLPQTVLMAQGVDEGGL